MTLPPPHGEGDKVYAIVDGDKTLVVIASLQPGGKCILCLPANGDDFPIAAVHKPFYWPEKPFLPPSVGSGVLGIYQSCPLREAGKGCPVECGKQVNMHNVVVIEKFPDEEYVSPTIHMET
jgi:hypothetical protein